MQITIPNIKGQLQAAMAKRLERAANDVNVTQLEQVANAFRNGGQPGKKWKRLWADTFVGKISLGLWGKFIKAMGAYNVAKEAKKPNAEKIVRALARMQKAEGNMKPATSYRKDGQVLVDDGNLKKSFYRKNVTASGNKATSTIYSTLPLAAWHQEGFHTNGPNFIPLTLKARREHQRKADPKEEGLEEGVDYIMAWAGVHIPDRPMIDYDDPVNQQQIKDTVARAIKRKV